MKTAAKIAGLAGGYLLMTALVVSSPGRSRPAQPASEAAARGLATWRDHSCVACHAIYGLGGHMGPDLTDAISRRGRPFARARILAGGGGMPPFALQEVEMSELLDWLAFVDSTGNYPPDRIWGRGFGDLP